MVWSECVYCWARTYWGCTWKHRSQLSQHDVLTFVQQDWNMTITTVLHSPYTPGRPARPAPAARARRCLRPGPGWEQEPGTTRPDTAWPGGISPGAAQSRAGPAPPVRADIPDNNVMVLSTLSLHLSIMSSLAPTRPKPSTHTLSLEKKLALNPM